MVFVPRAQAVTDEAVLNAVCGIIGLCAVVFVLVVGDWSREEFDKHDPDDFP